jgi:transposase
MRDVSRSKPSITVGIDLGDKYSHLCVLDAESGEVIEEGRLRTTPEAFRRRFASQRPMRIAIEAGTHSPWVSRLLEQECGHEVLVANPRKTRLLYSNKRKTDEIDAENLARLARLDPKLLYPLKHRAEHSQAHLAIIRSREALVICRTQLVNHVPKERSSPSVIGCPSARPGASTRERLSTSLRHSGRLSWAHLGADRLTYGAYPRV